MVGVDALSNPPAEYSENLQALAAVNNSPPILPYGVAPTYFGTVQDNLPISEPAASVVGYPATSFLDDYYNRVHILPGVLSLGNLLSSQSREVEVWSAYFEPQLLSDIEAVGDDGITLQGPEDPPTSFAELESRLYSLSISTNGSPVIDAHYTFNFELDTPELVITGRRVVVWPFIPQTKHKEMLEWKTDILPSFNSEQRLALRAAPRQSFSYQFYFDPKQFSKAKAIATQWAHRVYGIPVWSEATRLGSLSQGITEILMDTSFADYRANDIILIWSSDTDYLAAENLSVLADRITLKLPLERSFTNAYVMPMRFSRTLQGIDFKRGPNELIVANGTFQVSANADLGSAVGYPQHRGKDVLTDHTIIVGDLSERISRSITAFDNGSGPISVDVNSNWITSSKSLSFDTLTRQARWAARRWIHSRRGRQRGFWLPSWNQDLRILEDVGSSASALTVEPISYPLYYGVTDIMIQLKNGNRIFARVLSGAKNLDGNEVLTLDSQVGTSFAVADIDLACFMSHVRFNTDRVEINHDVAGRFATMIPAMETPE